MSITFEQFTHYLKTLNGILVINNYISINNYFSKEPEKPEQHLKFLIFAVFTRVYII